MKCLGGSRINLTQKTAFYLLVVNFIINLIKCDLIIYEGFLLKENTNVLA